jgi:hypothetical protein
MKARLEELQAKLAIHEENANSQTTTIDSYLESEPLQASNTVDQDRVHFKPNQISQTHTDGPKQPLRPKSPTAQTTDEILSEEGTVGFQQSAMSKFAPKLGYVTIDADIMSLDCQSRARMSSQEIIFRDLFELHAQLSNKLNDLQQDRPEFIQQHDAGTEMARGI